MGEDMKEITPEQQAEVAALTLMGKVDYQVEVCPACDGLGYRALGKCGWCEEKGWVREIG